jgi:Tol biopolymer transport system component
METQTFSLSGLRITVFPDKIYLHENQQKKVIVQQPNIHEAILSPDGKWLAFFTEDPATYEASIWIMSLKKRKTQLLTKANTGMSLLFSLDGDRLFYQEKPEKEGEESQIYSISSSGGRAERFTRGRELVGVVKQGKYKGALILRQERLHHMGVTKLNCAYALSTGGKNLGRLKNINCD